MAEKLGTLLVQKQLVTPEQVEEAVKLQVIYGGRIGTNLVELGHIDLETLSSVLAEQRHVAAVTVAELEATTQATLDLLPAALAEKHLAFPLRLDRRSLHVAMASPFDFESVDALGFATGYRIVPKICPELRLVYYLEKRYGIERRSRYIRLADDLATRPAPGALPGAGERRRFLTATPELAPATPAPAPPSTLDPALRPLAEGEYLTSEEDDLYSQAGGSLSQPSTAPAPASVAGIGRDATVAPPKPAGPPTLTPAKPLPATSGASGAPPTLAPAAPPTLAPRIPTPVTTPQPGSIPVVSAPRPTPPPGSIPVVSAPRPTPPPGSIPVVSAPRPTPPPGSIPVVSAPPSSAPNSSTAPSAESEPIELDSSDLEPEVEVEEISLDEDHQPIDEPKPRAPAGGGVTRTATPAPAAPRPSVKAPPLIPLSAAASVDVATMQWELAADTPRLSAPPLAPVTLPAPQPNPPQAAPEVAPPAHAPSAPPPPAEAVDTRAETPAPQDAPGSVIPQEASIDSEPETAPTSEPSPAADGAQTAGAAATAAPIDLMALAEPPENEDVPQEPEPEYKPPPGMMLVEELLARAADREKLAEGLLWFGEGRFSFNLIFVVRGDLATGWRGFGPGVDQTFVDRLNVPLELPSVLKRAIDARETVVCERPETPLDRRLAAFCGLHPRSTLVAFPIFARDRVINVVLGTRGTWPLRENIADETNRVAAAVGRAYERLLLLRKRIDD